MLKNLFLPAALSLALTGCGGSEDDYNRWKMFNPDRERTDYIRVKLAKDRHNQYQYQFYSSGEDMDCVIHPDLEVECSSDINSTPKEKTSEEIAADNARYEARGAANEVVHLLAINAAFPEEGHITQYSIMSFNQHAADLAIQAAENNNRLAITDPDNNDMNNVNIKLLEGTAYETAVQLVKEANQKNVGADIIVSFVPFIP